MAGGWCRSSPPELAAMVRRSTTRSFSRDRSAPPSRLEMRLSMLAIALTLLGQGRDEKAVSLCGLSFKAPAGWVATTDRSYPAAEEACTGSLKSPSYDKDFAAGGLEHHDILTIRIYRKGIDGLREDWELRRVGGR